MTRPMTSLVGTDRAQLSSETLTLTVTGECGARISREKEKIVMSLPQLLAHSPPTEKSARKAGRRRRWRPQPPDLVRLSSVGLLCCCCRALRGRRLRTDPPLASLICYGGSSAPLSGRSVGRSRSYSFFFLA